MEEKFLKSFLGIVESDLFQKDLTPGCTEEGDMMILGDVDADYHMVARSADLFLQLTELGKPATIVFIHRKPPCWDFDVAASIVTGGFFFCKSE